MLDSLNTPKLTLEDNLLVVSNVDINAEKIKVYKDGAYIGDCSIGSSYELTEMGNYHVTAYKATGGVLESEFSNGVSYKVVDAFCSANCRRHTLTYEEILELLSTTGTIDLSGAAIEKIKEQNNGKAIKFWVGTEAEFNALTSYPDDTVFIKTNDSTVTEIEKALGTAQTDITDIKSNLLIVVADVDDAVKKVNSVYPELFIEIEPQNNKFEMGSLNIDYKVYKQADVTNWGITLKIAYSLSGLKEEIDISPDTKHSYTDAEGNTYGISKVTVDGDYIIYRVTNCEFLSQNGGLSCYVKFNLQYKTENTDWKEGTALISAPTGTSAELYSFGGLIATNVSKAQGFVSDEVNKIIKGKTIVPKSYKADNASKVNITTPLAEPSWVYLNSSRASFKDICDVPTSCIAFICLNINTTTSYVYSKTSWIPLFLNNLTDANDNPKILQVEFHIEDIAISDNKNVRYDFTAMLYYRQKDGKLQMSSDHVSCTNIDIDGSLSNSLYISEVNIIELKQS